MYSQYSVVQRALRKKERFSEKWIEVGREGELACSPHGDIQEMTMYPC